MPNGPLPGVLVNHRVDGIPSKRRHKNQGETTMAAPFRLFDAAGAIEIVLKQWWARKGRLVIDFSGFLGADSYARMMRKILLFYLVAADDFQIQLYIACFFMYCYC